MKLKKIELNGFKSFAKKTSINFLSGKEKNNHQPITAIVGPNGSGKSNIADALRWVMGEQSLKNLRGKKSQDVIFSGSHKKTSKNIAEVSLFLDNSDKKISLDYDEVVITRKLYRSGEAEYLINNNKVRLLDIVDLLGKAGIGSGSYTVVNQGLTDAILNASSWERRNILEEAAGVKIFQIKLKRAEQKLQNSFQNLIRVEDLIKEIQPRLRYLKRQSQKAKRKQKIENQLGKKEEILLSLLWNDIQKEKEKYLSQKQEASIDLMNEQRKIDELTEELKNNSENYITDKNKSRLEELKRQSQEKINHIEKEVAIYEGKKEIINEKIINERSIHYISIDLDYIKERWEEIYKIQLDIQDQIKKAKNGVNFNNLKEKFLLLEKLMKKLFQEMQTGKRKISQDAKNLKKIQELKKQENDIKNKLNRNVQKLVKFKKIVKDLENKLEKIFKEEHQQRLRFLEIEQIYRKKQESLNNKREVFNEVKIQLARINDKEENLKRKILQNLNKAPQDLLNVEKINKNVNLEKLEREVYFLKNQKDRLGEIDPLILEEYQETLKRFDFLNKEKEDIEKAIISLKKIIKEMKEKINTNFEITFNKINQEFSKYFKIIFGGGKAKLFKIHRFKNVNEDPNQLEDSSSKKRELGIEIEASPPGKQIKHLSMLSGGERSLTSIALLFAIISYNPPPFIVLDEVEAALDESNSRRFSQILKELSRQTQFIAITHNRETMRQADTLYGVTMENDGVSKLLSVRLDQD